jgi:hypothetical protein
VTVKMTMVTIIDDMTMREFVLDALRDKGLDVRPDDLMDLRKERP